MRTSAPRAGDGAAPRPPARLRSWPAKQALRLLALTHLSSRYSGSDVAAEAQALFPATVVPRDFDVVEIPFPERGEPALVPRGSRRSRAG